MRRVAPPSTAPARLERRWLFLAVLFLRHAMIMNGTTSRPHLALAYGRLKAPLTPLGTLTPALLIPAFNGRIARIAPPQLVAVGVRAPPLATQDRIQAQQSAHVLAAGCRAPARALRPIHATHSTRAVIARPRTRAVGVAIRTRVPREQPPHHRDVSRTAGRPLTARAED